MGPLRFMGSLYNEETPFGLDSHVTIPLTWDVNHGLILVPSKRDNRTYILPNASIGCCKVPSGK
jgi:hypothetical protein